MRIASLGLCFAATAISPSFANPIQVEERNVQCAVVDAAVTLFQQAAQATQFCSEFLSIQPTTSTAYATSTLTSTIQTTVSATVPVVITAPAVTVTSTTVPTTVQTQYNTVTATSTSTTTQYSAITISITVTSTVASITGTILDKRALATPSCFKGYAQSALSSACSCLSIQQPKTTVSATRTVTTTTLATVTSSSTTTTTPTVTVQATSYSTAITLSTTTTTTILTTAVTSTTTVILPVATATALETFLIHLPASPSTAGSGNYGQVGEDAYGDVYLYFNEATAATADSFILDPQTGSIKAVTGSFTDYVATLSPGGSLQDFFFVPQSSTGYYYPSCSINTNDQLGCTFNGGSILVTLADSSLAIYTRTEGYVQVYPGVVGIGSVPEAS